MRTGDYLFVAVSAAETVGPPVTPLRPGFLHLVSTPEMHRLRQTLARGELPLDLERKLSQLEARSIMHQFIAQNCRLLAMVLMASYAGMFREGSERDCEEILRVLAYVQKDEDAIADYTTGGFADDLQEVRAAISRYEGLLKTFKAWRLCNQVPGMWRN